LWCERTDRELVQAPFLLALMAPLGLGVALAKPFAEGRNTGMLVGVAAVTIAAVTAVAIA
jgi:hypothetical protein